MRNHLFLLPIRDDDAGDVADSGKADDVFARVEIDDGDCCAARRGDSGVNVFERFDRRADPALFVENPDCRLRRAPRLRSVSESVGDEHLSPSRRRKQSLSDAAGKSRRP